MLRIYIYIYIYIYIIFNYTHSVSALYCMGSMGCCVYIYIYIYIVFFNYSIAGKFGGELNLAVWPNRQI